MIDLNRQAEAFLASAKTGEIPGNVQAFAEQGVAKTREAYVQLAAVAKENAKTAETVLTVAQTGARTLGERLLDNTTRNTEAVFTAASEIARAKSLPEVAKLQADFMRRQFEVAGLQTKEFFELSAQIAKHTFETMNTATTKTFEQAKKAG
jgi:hypothetical protein